KDHHGGALEQPRRGPRTLPPRQGRQPHEEDGQHQTHDAENHQLPPGSVLHFAKQQIVHGNFSGAPPGMVGGPRPCFRAREAPPGRDVSQTRRRLHQEDGNEPSSLGSTPRFNAPGSFSSPERAGKNLRIDRFTYPRATVIPGSPQRKTPAVPRTTG